MPRIFTKYTVNNAPTTRHFYVPRHVSEIKIQASGIGGNGGNGNGTFCGGGGGAAGFVDEIIRVLPGSRLLLSIPTTLSDNNYLSYFDQITGQEIRIIWRNGLSGANAGATPGNGGESGIGCLGGIGSALFSESLYPEGVIDLNNNIHSTGGFGGVNTSTSRLSDYAYESGRTNKRKLKHTSGDQMGVSLAMGGCSYWGGASSFGASELSYGAGGYGVKFGSGAPGGPGFFSIIWDDL